MAYDLEAGIGADLPIGDRYYGPREWAGQGGGRDGEEERTYLQGMADAAGPHAGRGPRSYQRSRARILEDVNEALTRDPALDATEIEVEVEAGEVTLRGTVDSRGDRWYAEDLVSGVPGVRDVHNCLRARNRQY